MVERISIAPVSNGFTLNLTTKDPEDDTDTDVVMIFTNVEEMLDYIQETLMETRDGSESKA